MASFLETNKNFMVSRQNTLDENASCKIPSTDQNPFLEQNFKLMFCGTCQYFAAYHICKSASSTSNDYFLLHYCSSLARKLSLTVDNTKVRQTSMQQSICQSHSKSEIPEYHYKNLIIYILRALYVGAVFVICLKISMCFQKACYVFQQLLTRAQGGNSVKTLKVT